MACTCPITTATQYGNIQVGCKQCLSCRISRQSALSLRALLESRTTSSPLFWTLTYADAPEKGGWADFQKFMKRYRQWNLRKGNLLPIRYLGVGEYGTKTKRFHYHALTFNGLNPDKIPHQTVSRTKLWPPGFVYIGTVTPGSIRYTARYCLKFQDVDHEPLAAWSKNPPLGADGIIELARYMRVHGYRLDGYTPTTLNIEGKTYRLDDTMRRLFAEEYHGSYEPRSPLSAHSRYRETLMFGDPIAQQTLRNEERNRFYETARFVNDHV